MPDRHHVDLGAWYIEGGAVEVAPVVLLARPFEVAHLVAAFGAIEFAGIHVRCSLLGINQLFRYLAYCRSRFKMGIRLGLLGRHGAILAPRR